jgi:hypothetical protein
VQTHYEHIRRKYGLPHLNALIVFAVEHAGTLA